MTNPRFFSNDATIAIVGSAGTYGFCFADSSADGAYETHHWVLDGTYQAPPHATDQLAEPAQVDRRYLSADAWRNALFNPATNPLWPGTQAIYLKANCKLFPSITSLDASDYDVPFPEPIPQASDRHYGDRDDCGRDRVRPFEIDPGEVFMYDPTTGVQTGAAIRQVSSPTSYRELWLLKDNYTPPGPSSSQALSGYPAGHEHPHVPTRDGFLSFYKPLWEPGYHLVSVSVTQYDGYFPAP